MALLCHPFCSIGANKSDLDSNTIITEFIYFVFVNQFSNKYIFNEKKVEFLIGSSKVVTVERLC